MATNWPYAADAWGVKTDFIDLVMAAHVNNLQDATMAIETEIARTYRPDLTPAVPSAYDDEFETGALDVKWTPINCGPGAVDLLSVAAAQDAYDATTYVGMMALQPGRDNAGAAGHEAEAAILRQTVALAANCKIICKLHFTATKDMAAASGGIAGILLSGAAGFNDNDYIWICLDPFYNLLATFEVGYIVSSQYDVGGAGALTLFCTGSGAQDVYLMVMKTGNDFSVFASPDGSSWGAAVDGSAPDVFRITYGAGVMVRLSIFSYWFPAAAEANLPNPIAAFDFVRYFTNNTPLVNA